MKNNKNQKIKDLKKERIKLLITILKDIIKRIEENNIDEEEGVSISSFCGKYKNIVINSTKALEWLDKEDYTKKIDKDVREITSKGKQHLKQGCSIRMELHNLNFAIQKYPIIPKEEEKFFIKIFNKDNF